MKKKKAEKEKKEGEKNGNKKDTNLKAKTTSQERRDASSSNKRDLSQPKDNRFPQRFGNSCAQVCVRDMGNKPSRNGSDSDEEEEYNTPPETLESDNDLEEENDDPNVPENSDDGISEDEDNEILQNMQENSGDKISEDEDNEILQNTAENDSAIETANLRNFPDLLRLNKSGWNTNTSSMTQSTKETFPPSKCSGAKPKKPSTNGSWLRSNTPPCDRPPDPWRGLSSQDQLMWKNEEKIFQPW